MPSSNQPLVVLSVVNWNNAKDTLACLDSLQNLAYPHFEVVIVENGSQDGSLAKISSYRAPYPLHFLPQKENLGFSGGHNIGMRYAYQRGADFIFLLNNDAVVAPDILEKLVAAAHNNPRVGVFGPVIYYLSEHSQTQNVWFAGGTLDWFDIARIGKHLTAIPHAHHEIIQTAFITGCALFIRREVFEQIGGLDERFFLYFEDLDYNIRAKKAGWGIGLVPAASAWHKVSATALPQTGAPAILCYHQRNGMLLAHKHAPIFIKLYMHCWAGLKITRQIAKFLIKKDRPFAGAIITGITDYYRGRFGKLTEKFI